MTFSLAGNLLVASTIVTDSVFARGVCLTMQHDENGAIAVMLNRPIWPPPAELIKLITGGTENESQESKPTARTSRLDRKISELQLATPSPGMHPAGFLHFGGPISGPVLAIHGSLTLAEAQTGAGIYVAAQKEHLEQLVREKISDFNLVELVVALREDDSLCITEETTETAHEPQLICSLGLFPEGSE